MPGAKRGCWTPDPVLSRRPWGWPRLKHTFRHLGDPWSSACHLSPLPCSGPPGMLLGDKMLLPLFLSPSPPRVHSSSEPTPCSPPVKSVCLYVCARARLCPSGDAQRKRPHKGGQGCLRISGALIVKGNPMGGVEAGLESRTPPPHSGFCPPRGPGTSPRLSPGLSFPAVPRAVECGTA